jgi:hypothetical protein
LFACFGGGLVSSSSSEDVSIRRLFRTLRLIALWTSKAKHRMRQGGRSPPAYNRQIVGKQRNRREI